MILLNLSGKPEDKDVKPSSSMANSVVRPEKAESKSKVKIVEPGKDAKKNLEDDESDDDDEDDNEDDDDDDDDEDGEVIVFFFFFFVNYFVSSHILCYLNGQLINFSLQVQDND